MGGIIIARPGSAVSSGSASPPPENQLINFIDFEIPSIGDWSETFDWTKGAFVTLQENYKLGDDRYFVRPKLLDALATLTQEERQEFFSGIQIKKHYLGL